MRRDLIAALIEEVTGTASIQSVELIQQLWSGYGSIRRFTLQGGCVPSVIVKEIVPPSSMSHPRGWDSDLSHERKLKSYEIESTWYEKWASRCGSESRVPYCLAIRQIEGKQILVLEDLDAAGYPRRIQAPEREVVDRCLSWLANFHATFLGEQPEGLWEVGTYWHLDTRPDELEVLKVEDPTLFRAASAIDHHLKSATYQTVVHGDAKIANFCFSKNGREIAVVDFQYVGGGCGMKDVAYFLGSCLDETACETYETALLDVYFNALKQALSCCEHKIDFDALEREWRSLYVFAWADFHRFIKGWSPGHWKVHGYSERLTRKAMDQLER